MSLFKKEKDINDYLESKFKKKKFSDKIAELFNANKNDLANFYEELLVLLIESDMGVQAAQETINKLEKLSKDRKYNSYNDLMAGLKEILIKSYQGKKYELKQQKNQLIMLVGVNGSGKTTSISKLAHYYMNKGLKVGLIAADTFRAGAVDQLLAWANKLEIQCITGKENADPSSVLVEGCRYYKENPVDLIIADTAGRLSSKVNLMNELEKMVRVTKRELENDDITIWLSLDATIGQNAIIQAEKFMDFSKVNGVILTKMDGTSKGGIALAINQKYNLPISFITFGENIEAIKVFDIVDYIDELVS